MARIGAQQRKRRQKCPLEQLADAHAVGSQQRCPPACLCNLGIWTATPPNSPDGCPAAAEASQQPHGTYSAVTRCMNDTSIMCVPMCCTRFMHLCNCPPQAAGQPAPSKLLANSKKSELTFFYEPPTALPTSAAPKRWPRVLLFTAP